jgi:hypothetical protein
MGDPIATKTAPRAHVRRGEILLLLGGVIVGLVILEATSRVVLRATPPKGGYAPVRGHRSREPLNAAGYRDTEHLVQKGTAIHRAVFLGDSFTYGVGVLFDDTYPKRVERALSSERGETWESIVLATPGFDTEQEAGVAAHEAFAFSPDLLVLGYVLNDAEDQDSAEQRRAEAWTRREEERRHPSLWRRSAFLSLVGDRLHATLENRARIENQRGLYREDRRGLIAVRRSVREIADLAKQHGIPFVVVVFPLFANPLGDDYPFADLHRIVGDLCRNEGARVVDLLPYYRDLDWRLLVVEGALDEHPNELAHRIAAQGLLAGLRDVLPPPAPPIETRHASARTHAVGGG